MKKSVSPFELLSERRSELMGFSILWVVWFHSSFRLDFFPAEPLNTFFEFIKKTGYGGVDIFLLLSGMGIYRSLSKNNVSDYIKNRLRKIVPVWWAYLALYYLLGKFVFDVAISAKDALGIATFMGFWLNDDIIGNWYVYAIMLFYLISPVIYSLLNESRNKKRMCLALVIISVILSFPFFGVFKLIVFSRLAIYVIGMYFAADLQNAEFTKKSIIFCAVIFMIFGGVLFVLENSFAKYLWPYGLWWYPFIPLAPAMSLLLTLLFQKISEFADGAMWCLRKTGEASLEILLISDLMFENAGKMNIRTPSEHLTALLIIVISLTGGFVFHYIIEFCKGIFSDKDKGSGKKKRRKGVK